MRVLELKKKEINKLKDEKAALEKENQRLRAR
jgi:hypothetical protein